MFLKPCLQHACKEVCRFPWNCKYFSIGLKIMTTDNTGTIDPPPQQPAGVSVPGLTSIHPSYPSYPSIHPFRPSIPAHGLWGGGEREKAALPWLSSSMSAAGVTGQSGGRCVRLQTWRRKTPSAGRWFLFFDRDGLLSLSLSLSLSADKPVCARCQTDGRVALLRADVSGDADGKEVGGGRKTNKRKTTGPPREMRWKWSSSAVGAMFRTRPERRLLPLLHLQLLRLHSHSLHCNQGDVIKPRPCQRHPHTDTNTHTRYNRI